jgi:cell wall-associated NlpC family hydrolase
VAARTSLNGLALAEIAAGVALAWSGITNQTMTATISALIRGQSPAQGPATEVPLSAGNLPGSGPGLASESVIASDALSYQGAGYVWGGSPAEGIGNWDCSSFANWVCGHDVGLPIPGYPAGAYDGSVHGPTTVEWLAWGGLETVGVSAAVAEPGDLCVWQTHMGIATGGGDMISALNPTDGTTVTTIAGGAPPGEVLLVRRYVASVARTVPSG